METPHKNTIRDQAADWVTRIESGEISPDNSEPLRAWLSDDPEHVRVFRKMLDVYTASEYVAEQYAGAPARRTRPGFGLAAAASFVLAVAVGFWVFSSQPLTVQTHTGERILMSLEDGSSVHLNSQSTVKIRFTDDARVATLPRGEVVFAVNDQDPRPFFVHSEGLDVRVTGTTFQVSRYDDETSVAVLEGEVLVSPAEGTGDGSSVSLRRGQQVIFENASLGTPRMVDTGRITGWREGWLYIDGRPLQYLVDRLNRHYDGQIEVRDRELAASEVSVALRLDRRDETLARLERLLPLDVEELPGNRSVIHGRH